MTDHAAALTYYSLLSLFPALLFAVAVLGVFGQQGLIDDAAEYLRDAGARASTVDSVTKALDSAQSQRSTALDRPGPRRRAVAQRRVGRVRRRRPGAQPRLAGGGGPRLRAPQAQRPRVDAGRPRSGAGHLRADLPRRRPRLRRARGRSASARPPPRSGGSRAGRRRCSRRWRSTRSSSTPRPTSRSAGSSGSRRAPSSASLTWILASALFFFYVSNFSSYSATYGAFAAAVILLVWLWLTNVVLLFGAELNAVDRPAPLARAPARLRRPAAAGQGRRPSPRRAAASPPPARSRASAAPGSRRTARGAGGR